MAETVKTVGICAVMLYNFVGRREDLCYTVIHV
jgi:hypothetical protein